MKILHIAPNAPYNDNWGYQENLLPKYQKRLGHEVTLIITNQMHVNGNIVETECADYVTNDGVRVIRLKKKKYIHRTLTNLNSHLEVYKYLVNLKPDFVFYHGLISTTIFDVIKYKKKINPKCIIVQDNHLDYNIGSNLDNLKEKLICFYYRYINKRSVPFVDRVYGVTPWRKTYAEDYYHIPSNKTDVLLMGADDDKINFANKEKIRKEIRNKYMIRDSDFLIVTGGKIDHKKNVHLLMKACNGMNSVKLLIFGQVLDDIVDEFKSLLSKSENIIYVGWISADKVYDFFFAADLVFFPGQHSVLWEQACAAKVPCVFKKWDGMSHVNNGGNSDFISPVTISSLKEKIAELKYTPKYFRMMQIAQSDATDIYLYSSIAEKSLECAIRK